MRFLLSFGGFCLVTNVTAPPTTPPPTTPAPIVILPTTRPPTTRPPVPTQPMAMGGSLSFVGCFVDLYPIRVMPYNMRVFNTHDFNPQHCVTHCQRYGYAHAGVENGNECWCGGLYSRGGRSDACKTPCRGNPGIACGGVNALSVYRVPQTVIEGESLGYISGHFFHMNEKGNMSKLPIHYRFLCVRFFLIRLRLGFGQNVPCLWLPWQPFRCLAARCDC